MKLDIIHEQFLMYGIQLGYNNITQLEGHFKNTFQVPLERAKEVILPTLERLQEYGAVFIDTETDTVTIISSEIMDEDYVTAYQTIHNIEHLAYQIYVQKIMHLDIPRIKDNAIVTLANTMGGSGTMNYQHFQFAIAHLCQMGILIEKYGVYYFDKVIKEIYDAVVNQIDAE